MTINKDEASRWLITTLISVIAFFSGGFINSSKVDKVDEKATNNDKEIAIVKRDVEVLTATILLLTTEVKTLNNTIAETNVELAKLEGNDNKGSSR